MTQDEKEAHHQDGLKRLGEARKALKVAHRHFKMAGKSISAEYINDLLKRLNDDLEIHRCKP